MPGLDLAFLNSILDRRHALIKGVAVILGLLGFAAGAGEGLDRSLRMARDQLRAHQASGEIHIVEIDARSIGQIDRWPWPRSVHGDVVDRLHGAGVRSIAFDVDFSSLSTPAQDDAFAAALARAQGSVTLPTLRQSAGAGSSDYIENIPAISFRDKAFLAAVNVLPDSDGYIRRMLLGVTTMATPRPSLAAMVAERQAETGRSFEIDYAIDPASIPRHSFIDVIRGRVDPASLRGKRIIIGTTAIEMGDRYAVPRHGVIPGVVVQALAAETLLKGPIPSEASALWPLLLALLLIAVTCRPGRRGVRIALFGGGGAAILALPLITEQAFALTMPLAPALLTLGGGATASFAAYLALRFRQRALTDASTGLPNLPALVADAAGLSRPIVIVAQIDRFAAIAAGLGANATVNLIHRIRDRLAFADMQTIYRIDEASLAWTEEQESASTLEERLTALRALMRSPVDCGRLIDVTLNFGIAEPSGAGPKQQVSNASLAAVRAARSGARWERFSDEGSEETNWHLSLLGELDAAMAKGEVWNAYQPKLDISSGRIVGVEALVRWEHPQRGRIAPDAFIPLVEEHGRIRDLTAHVFSRALVDGANWRALGFDLGIAVNVSATLLADEEFVGLMQDMLQGSPLPREHVTFEVTESAAMSDPAKAVAALESWRALGVNISIDDYGTGQSSLGYLQKLPATELKIDKSFIETLGSDRRNAILVRSTIAMAHELGMKVVAEGIESAECLHILAELGCDTGQGYHIARPMPAPAIAEFLADSIRVAA